MVNENWCDVPGFEKAYQVSSEGRIRSLDRMVTDSIGRKKLMIGTLLKQNTNRGGYHHVGLCNSGKTHTKTVHQLVMAAFSGPCPENQEVMHLDGVRTNNKLCNLRYGSRSCNSAFTIDHGTVCSGSLFSGENNSLAKFTNNQAGEIRRVWATDGVTKAALAREYNVSRPTIRRIINNKSYKEEENE